MHLFVGSKLSCIAWQELAPTYTWLHDAYSILLKAASLAGQGEGEIPILSSATSEIPVPCVKMLCTSCLPSDLG